MRSCLQRCSHVRTPESTARARTCAGRTRKQFPFDQIWMIEDDAKNDCKAYIKFVKDDLYVHDALVAVGGQRDYAREQSVLRVCGCACARVYMFRCTRACVYLFSWTRDRHSFSITNSFVVTAVTFPSPDIRELFCHILNHFISSSIKYKSGKLSWKV